MARKYIIDDNRVVLGDVEEHIDLTGGVVDKTRTTAGGRWHYDEDAKKVYFYDSSFVFGSATPEQFQNAWDNTSSYPFVKGCKIFFTSHHSKREEFKILPRFIKIVKLLPNCGLCCVQIYSDDHNCSLQHVLRMTNELKKDFPGIQDEEININKYGGYVKKRITFVETMIPLEIKRPSTYTEVDKIDFIL